VLARDLAIPVEELDERVILILEKVFGGSDKPVAGS
jgi:hypothetical protein